MSTTLEGKAALVTGSSRGVGAATAIQLAAAGCHVAVNYNHSRQEALEVADQARALGVQSVAIQADVSDDAACRRMVEEAAGQLGRLDFLINNAGWTRFIPHRDLDAVAETDWDRIFAINLKGPFFCVRAARRFLAASDSGQVINIASIAGIAASGSSIPYCASKAALINMTVSMARALGPEIRVNAVAPGFIADRWTEEGLGEGYAAAKAARESKAPLGKVCLPEDVAAAVLSLVTGSKLITGQVLVVDGGDMIA